MNAIQSNELRQEQPSPDNIRELLQVKPPSDRVDWINALFYGDPGAGKTFLGGTADDDIRTRPLLVLDIEGGLATIRDRQGVDTVSIRALTKLEETYNKLYYSIRDNQMYYKTLMIDSLTELAALDMRVIMQQAYEKNPETVDKDVPSPREWGKSREHIRTIVRAFRDLPCNVIFTAHAGYRLEDGQPTKIYPGFSGKLATEVPGFMDIVGYLRSVDTMQGGIVTVNRYLQVEATSRVQAKDRTSRLGQVVKDPTVPLIWDLIHNTGTTTDNTNNEGTE